MESKDNMVRIQRLARVLELVCLGVAVAVVPLTAAYFAAFNVLPDVWTREAASLATASVLPGWTRLLCFLAAMVPGAGAMLTVLRLRRLFALYREGRIFTPDNVTCFRSLARALLGWAVASMAFTPLYGLAVTAANPPGRHILSLGIDSGDLALFFIAAMAVVIARVMDEARRLDEEQALTV